MRSKCANALERVRPLTTLHVAGFALCESVYCAAREIPAQRQEWATLYLTIDGSYQI